MTLVGGGADWEVCILRSLGIAAYPISLVYGRSLWAELNGGEISLHWKANMLPLFSIMTLWREQLIDKLDLNALSIRLHISISNFSFS